jgi:hypothetical protein
MGVPSPLQREFRLSSLAATVAIFRFKASAIQTLAACSAERCKHCGFSRSDVCRGTRDRTDGLCLRLGVCRNRASYSRAYADRDLIIAFGFVVQGVSV